MISKKIRRAVTSVVVALFCLGVSACANISVTAGQSDSSGMESGPDVSNGASESEGSTGGSGTGDEELPQADPYAYEPNFSTQMPRIDVTTVNGDISFAYEATKDYKPDYAACSIQISNCDEEYQLTATGGVKVRGNYTANYEKKPFRIKFDKKQPMLGVNGGAKCKSWVLLADYKDGSMLRNSAAFYLGNKILGSDGYYCSDFRPVELYLDGNYWGVYLLAEQQQVNSNRMDINEPEDGYQGTDIGYLLEYDGYYFEEDALNQFTMNYNNHAPLKTYSGENYSYWQDGITIKNDIYSQAQHDFIASYLENVYRIGYYATRGKAYSFNAERTAISEDKSLTPEQAVEKVMDVDSLVDSYLIQEIACDFDLGWSSFYMDVDMSATGDKILRFEAPWDFDSAFGNRDCITNGEGIYAGNNNNVWLSLFIREDWFLTKIKAKWEEVAKSNTFGNMFAYLEKCAQTYPEKYAENYAKWQNIGVNIGGELVYEAYSCKTQKAATEYLIRWTKKRINYLNTVWGDNSVLFDPDGQATDSEITIPKENKQYRFEAERMSIDGGIALRTGNNSSGNGYLGNVAGGAGKTVTISLNASSADSVYFFFGLSKREFSFNIFDYFSITVNGRAIARNEGAVVGASDSPWHDWTGVFATKIDLAAGNNTIVITTTQSEGTNLDYFDIYSAVTLQ